MPKILNVKQANLIRKREVASDKFWTPKSLVKVHLEMLIPYVREGDLILEPARGQCAYYDYFELAFPTSHYDWCEIDEGKDYLEYNLSVDIIVTNPPFSLLDKFIERTILLKPRVFSFLMNQYACTPCRLRAINDAGYYIVNYHLTRVNRWFGVSVIVIFSREVNQNVISFDCHKHLLEV